MLTLKELIISAKVGDEVAFEEIAILFKPLLVSVAFRSGAFDEDCYQECLIALHKAILRFEIR
ncbi:helix-turn-helix domain-containing protein [Enterococcus casseliflavus]|nr:helix-turn-helix domain-containing protein [Enterococcus casseliflavus]